MYAALAWSKNLERERIMNFLGASETGTVSAAKQPCAVTSDSAVAPLRRRPGKAVFAALLLGFIGAIGFNVHVFSNAPQRTASYGFSEVLQIYSQGQTLDEHRPARLD
jgi:hypothetical protein